MHRTLAIALLSVLACASVARAQPSVTLVEEDPLIVAAERGDAGAVRRLLEEGSDPEVRTLRLDFTHNWTPLLHAVRNRHEEVVRVLLDAGAETTVDYIAEQLYQASNTKHSILIAAQYSNRAIFEMLLDAGADPSIEQDSSQTVLHLAASNTDPELDRYILHDLGMDHDARTEQGRTALFYACFWQRELPDPLDPDPIPRDPQRERESVFVLLELLAAGIEVDVFDVSNRTALLVAASQGLTTHVEVLLAWGATMFEGPMIDPDIRTAYPILIGAADSGDRGVIKVLADAGADTEVRAGLGGEMDLLAYAVDQTNPLVIQELIELGFDPLQVDHLGRTLLMRACLCFTDTSRRRDQHRGSVPIAQQLVDAGVPIDAKDAQGRTALHYAVGSGVPELVRLMIDAGADLDATDEAGLTPLDYTKKDAPRLARYRINQAGRDKGRAILEEALRAE